MPKQRIYSVKEKGLSEMERLDLARLLIKAGYTVRVGREKIAGKNTWIYFVEYWEEEEQ